MMPTNNAIPSQNDHYPLPSMGFVPLLVDTERRFEVFQAAVTSAGSVVPVASLILHRSPDWFLPAGLFVVSLPGSF